MVSNLETSYLRTEKHEENICQEKKIFSLKADPPPPPPSRHNNVILCRPITRLNVRLCRPITTLKKQSVCKQIVFQLYLSSQLHNKLVYDLEGHGQQYTEVKRSICTARSIFQSKQHFFSWSTFFLYLNQSELQNIMSTVLNRKGEEVMGCVILNLSAACARNYHFLGRTIIFEGRGSFLTILKCVQIKNKPICAKQNISSLSTVEYLNLSRICFANINVHLSYLAVSHSLSF